jgi:hypothetical protein
MRTLRLLLILLLMPLLARAASPSFNSFLSTQFTNNGVVIGLNTNYVLTWQMVSTNSFTTNGNNLAVNTNTFPTLPTVINIVTNARTLLVASNSFAAVTNGNQITYFIPTNSSGSIDTNLVVTWPSVDKSHFVKSTNTLWHTAGMIPRSYRLWPTNLTTYIPFGDSFTTGDGATSFANSYVGLLTNYFQIALAQRGVSGTLLNSTGQINSIYRTITTNTALYSLLTGVNDASLWTNQTDIANYKSSLMAASVWMSLPPAAKQTFGYLTNRSSGFGTNTFFGMGSLATTNSSQSVTSYISGPVIYVGYTRFTNNSSGYINISVNGFDAGNFSSDGGYASTNPPANGYVREMAALARVFGNPTTNTVVITTSATGTNAIQFVASKGGIPFSDMSAFFIGNTSRKNGAGYSAAGSVMSPQSVNDYNVAIADAVAVLSGDGLPVFMADTSARYVPELGMVSVDNIHPNDAGYAAIFGAFRDSISVAMPRPSVPASGNNTFNGAQFANIANNISIPYNAAITNITLRNQTNGFRLLGAIPSLTGPAGFELEFVAGFAGGTANLQAYDRDGAAYKNLSFSSLSTFFYLSGTWMFAYTNISGTGYMRFVQDNSYQKTAATNAVRIFGLGGITASPSNDTANGSIDYRISSAGDTNFPHLNVTNGVLYGTSLWTASSDTTNFILNPALNERTINMAANIRVISLSAFNPAGFRGFVGVLITNNSGSSFNFDVTNTIVPFGTNTLTIPTGKAARVVFQIDENRAFWGGAVQP